MPMNIPLVPPTDSVYKFAAVGGLVGFIAVAALVFYQTHELSRTILEAQINLARLGVEAERVAAISQPDTPETRDQYWDIRARDAELRARERFLMGQVRDIKAQVATAAVLGIGSIAFMSWGFSRWYERIQKPQDAALKRAASRFATDTAKEHD